MRQWVGQEPTALSPGFVQGLLHAAVALVVAVVVLRVGWTAVGVIAAGCVGAQVALRIVHWVARPRHTAPLAEAAHTTLNSLSEAGIVVATGGFASPLQPLLALSLSVYVLHLGARAGARHGILLIGAYTVGDVAVRGTSQLHHVLVVAALNGLVLAALLLGDRWASDKRVHILRTLAHELRNPQACAQVVAAFLARQLDAAEVLGHAPLRRTGDALTSAVRRVSVLLDQTLEALRWLERDVPLHRAPVDVREVLRASVDACRETWVGGLPQIDLEQDASTDAVWIAADRRHLERALGALVRHVLTLSAEGGSVKVRLRTRRRWATLAIAIAGAGLGRVDADAMFEVGARSARPDSVGLGLGLSLCRSIVRAHGGRVWADNGRGRATTVYVTLPVVTVPGTVGYRRAKGALAR